MWSNIINEDAVFVNNFILPYVVLLEIRRSIAGLN